MILSSTCYWFTAFGIPLVEAFHRHHHQTTGPKALKCVLSHSGIQPSRLFSTSFPLGPEDSDKDLLKWEKMHVEGGGIDTSECTNVRSPEIRVVTFDLDNTIWNTSATISHANDALAAFLKEKVPENNKRVESIMGMLFKANKDLYCPIECEKCKSPVLLTKLRKDAILQILEEQKIEHLDVDEIFRVWTDARHNIIPLYLAESVVSCLQEISDHGILVGAITDGNSDPRQVKLLAKFFDFCVNAEMVGISKPNKPVYLEAVKKALMHPLLQDLRPESFEIGAITDDVLENVVGPWWIHVGDDFVKDIVAAKSLNMRTIWTRELLKKGSYFAEKEKEESQRKVEDLLQTVSTNQVLKIQIGADDYLADSFRDEFADATVDSFCHIPGILHEWRKRCEFTKQEPKKQQLDSDQPSKVDPKPGSDSLKYCIACGVQLPSHAKFCSTCGEKQ